jgi:hypothetical protein
MMGENDRRYINMALAMKMIMKRAIPAKVLNNILLTFPSLYRTRIVNYETNMAATDDAFPIEDRSRAAGNAIECGVHVRRKYHHGELLPDEVSKTIYACTLFRISGESGREELG